MNSKLKATGFVVLFLFGTTFLGFGAWAFYQVGQTFKAAQSTPAKLNASLEMLNRPCNSRDKTGRFLKDGVFCNFDKLTTSIKNLSVITQIQVQQTKSVTDATARNMDRITEHLTPVLDSVKASTDKVGTLSDKVGDLTDSGKRLSDAGTVAIYQFNSNSAPLFAKSNEAVDHLNDYLKDKRINEIIQNFDSTAYNVAGITGHLDKVTGDLQVVADKAVAPKTKTDVVKEWVPFGLKAGISLGCLGYGPC